MTKDQIINGLDEADEVSYWPMLQASAGAAFLAVFSQFAATLYFSLQLGLSPNFSIWKNVLPYFTIVADQGDYNAVLFRSAIVSALVLIAFSVTAFITRRRLQILAGRAFAWINVGLIGVMHVARVTWLDQFASVETWMLALILVGLVGFAVCIGLVWVDYEDAGPEAGTETTQDAGSSDRQSTALTSQ